MTKLPTPRQLEASRKRWHKLIEREKKASAPLLKKMRSVEVSFDKQQAALEKKKAAVIKKLWAAIDRKRAPFKRRIEKEIAFKLS